MLAAALVDWMVEAQKWLYDGMTLGLKAAPGVAGFPAMMATAFGFGCLHALMPGHGKTLLFSYHLGQPSRIADGAATAMLLAITHVGLAAIFVLVGVKAVSVSFAEAGRSHTLEFLSAGLVTLIGCYLILRAVLQYKHLKPNGRALAIAAGFIPCPLTTFVLIYSIAHGRISAGIAAVLAMLSGIIVTLVVFAVSAVLLRERLGPILARTTNVRTWIGRAAELASGLLITAIGVMACAKAMHGT